MMNCKFFNFVNILTSKSTENFLYILKVLADNKEGKTLSNIIKVNPQEIWTREKVLNVGLTL